jgi:hypothetical protein
MASCATSPRSPCSSTCSQRSAQPSARVPTSLWRISPSGVRTHRRPRRKGRDPFRPCFRQSICFNRASGLGLASPRNDFCTVDYRSSGGRMTTWRRIGPPVVSVKAAEHRCDDNRLGQVVMANAGRDALADPLMGSSTAQVHLVLANQRIQVSVAKQENVVE